MIDRSKKSIVDSVLNLTNSEGVPVVYDSLGKDTFETSLDCLKIHGLMVSFDNATGAVPSVDILNLMHKGSLVFNQTTFFFLSERSAVAGKYIQPTIRNNFKRNNKNRRTVVLCP